MKKITLMLTIFGAFVFGATQANAQKYGATPQDSMECLMNNSLYQEYYKQKAYKDAYEPWKKVLEVCPMYHINTYIRGYNILVAMYNQATTPEEKEKYFQEMLSLFDKRGEFDGEPWNNIARKAQTYEQIKPQEKQKAFELYKQAKENADAHNTILDQQFCVQYLRATINYFASIKANNEQMSEMFDIYDYASVAMETSLTESSNALDSVTQINDTKAMAKLHKEVDNTRSNITALETLIEPFASCDKIVPIYQDRFDANPNDLALLKKITTNLERKNCMSSDLFLHATENLHKQEPTPRTASLMGQMYLNRNDYVKAAEYLEQSEKMATETSVKTKSALALAQCLMKTNKYSDAREAARRAMSYDKSYAGKATLLIANMYLATPGQNAAWAAYDAAARARSLDPSISADAGRIMSSAHSRFPSKEDLFFKNIAVGSSVGVGGWIGGSTTVKAR